VEKPSILVVDDDRDVLDLAEFFFREAGHQVHCVESGQKALEKIRDSRFTVMLTDYNMPGMDGVELAERARKISPELFIVMATGHPSRELSNLAAKAGIVKVFAKPLRLESLLNLIIEMIPPTSF